MTDHTVPIPDEAVMGTWDVLYDAGVHRPWRARVSDFTDEQIRAGELRAADAECNRRNDDLLRRAMAPIDRAARIIVNSGINEVVYAAEFRADDGLRRLEAAGIKVRRLG